jgi:hypothetical protein
MSENNGLAGFVRELGRQVGEHLAQAGVRVDSQRGGSFPSLIEPRRTVLSVADQDESMVPNQKLSLGTRFGVLVFRHCLWHEGLQVLNPPPV